MNVLHFPALLILFSPLSNAACVKYACLSNNDGQGGTCQNYPYNKCDSIDNCDGHCDNIFDRQCVNNQDCIIHSSPTPFPQMVPSPTVDKCYHSTKECEALHHGSGECFHDRLRCYKAGGTQFLPGLCGSGSCGCCVGFESTSEMSGSTKFFIFYIVTNALLILLFRYHVRRKIRIRSYYEYESENDSDYDSNNEDCFYRDDYDSIEEEDDREHSVKFKETSTKAKNRPITMLSPVKELRSSLESNSGDSDRIESMSLDRERKESPNKRSFAKQIIEEEGVDINDDDQSLSTISSTSTKTRKSRSAPRPRVSSDKIEGNIAQDSFRGLHETKSKLMERSPVDEDLNTSKNLYDEDERDSRIYMSNRLPVKRAHFDKFSSISTNDRDSDSETSETSSMAVAREKAEERQRRLDLLCDDCCGDFEWWYASAWVGWSFRLFIEALILPFVFGFLIYRWCHRQAMHREDILYERADSFESDDSYDSFTSSGEGEEEEEEEQQQQQEEEGGGGGGGLLKSKQSIGELHEQDIENKLSKPVGKVRSKDQTKEVKGTSEDVMKQGVSTKAKSIGLKAKFARIKAERAAASEGRSEEDKGKERIENKLGTHYHGVHGLHQRSSCFRSCARPCRCCLCSWACRTGQ